MPGRGPQTFKKRQKEQQRKERQQEKMAKRLARKQETGGGTAGAQEPAVEETPQPNAPNGDVAAEKAHAEPSRAT